MELITGSLTSATAVGLVPIAYYLGNGCLNRVRSVNTIKKNVICLPSKSGKTSLAKSLVSNKNVLLIDLDEFIKTVNEPSLLEKVEEAKKEGNTGLYSILYSKCSDEALNFVKKELKKDKNLRAIFLTSDFNWSLKRFKKDQIYVSIPSAKLHKEIVDNAPEGEKETIRNHRLEFIHQLPFESVRTYNSFQELENLVRERFDIQHKI